MKKIKKSYQKWWYIYLISQVIFIFPTQSYYNMNFITLPSSFITRFPWCFKGCVRYIFASLFCMSKREHLQNKEKRFLFHFKCSSRQSTFNILDIQMSWRHQMPRHETRNTYYWITWEVNTVWWWNLASLCNITK